MAGHNAKPAEPLLTRAAVVTALSVLSALLVKAGAGDVSAWLQLHSDEVAGTVLAAGSGITAWLARRHVTSLATPRDADGNKLAPVPAAPVDEAAVVLAAAQAAHPMGGQ